MEVLILVCGVLLGMFVSTLWSLRLRAGVLYVVQTHLEDTPQTLLELDYPIEILMKKNRVLLKVDHISTRK
jgi:hypothetical protein